MRGDHDWLRTDLPTRRRIGVPAASGGGRPGRSSCWRSRCTLGGTAVDGLTTGVLAWGLRLGFYLGVVLAALLVRRASIFTAMVQPPLVLVVGIVVGGMLFADTGGLYGTALKIIGTFPTMAIGTAAPCSSA